MTRTITGTGIGEVPTDSQVSHVKADSPLCLSRCYDTLVFLCMIFLDILGSCSQVTTDPCQVIFARINETETLQSSLGRVLPWSRSSLSDLSAMGALVL